MRYVLCFISIVILMYVIMSPVMILLTFMRINVKKEGVIFILWQIVNYALYTFVGNNLLFIIMTIISVPLLRYYWHLIKDEC